MSIQDWEGPLNKIKEKTKLFPLSFTNLPYPDLLVAFSQSTFHLLSCYTTFLTITHIVCDLSFPAKLWAPGGQESLPALYLVQWSLAPAIVGMSKYLCGIELKSR